MRILIIEDEKTLAGTLADIVRSSGMHADISHSGTEGLQLAETEAYDAIILDVMLPCLNGCEVVKSLRQKHIATPVLMLTARSSLQDRIRGLDAGADYYLTKPFENAELLACLRALLRRHTGIVSDSMHFGDLSLSLRSSCLACREKQITLRAKELEIMQLLIQNSSHYLPKETLFLKVWGYNSRAGANSVEAYISFLRKKLALLDSRVHIGVARNIGYKLEI